MDTMQYELVITPAHSRRSWLSPRDPEEGPGGAAHKGPQIQRASFFPSGFGLWGAKGNGDAGALHAVKRSEGLLAKEYVILSQKLPRLQEDATSPPDVSEASGGSDPAVGPHSSSSSRVPSARVGELFPAARRAASASGRFAAGSGAPGAARRLPETARQGEPEVAAILRGSSSGSHYLLAACTPKEKPTSPPAHPPAPSAAPQPSRYTDGAQHLASAPKGPSLFARSPVRESLLGVAPPSPEAEGSGRRAAIGSPRSPGSPGVHQGVRPGAARWRKRVLKPACACLPLTSSPSSTSSQGGREEVEEEEAPLGRARGGEGRRVRKKTRVGRGGEFQRLQGDEAAEGSSRKSGGGAEQGKVLGPRYWGAARRHAFMLSACWMGSGYELATTDATEGEEEQEAPAMEPRPMAQSSQPHFHPHLDTHSHSDRYSSPHSLSNTDPLSLSNGSSSSSSSSMTSPGMMSSFSSSTSAGTPSSSGPLSSDAPSSPLGRGAAGQVAKARGAEQDPACSLQGPVARRPSPPKERGHSAVPAPQPSTFVGVPELAIRFFRPSAMGSRGRKAARSMGPGEGYMSLPLEGHDSSREWVMEGIPAAAFQNASGVASAHSWAQSAIQASVSEAHQGSETRDEALPNVWGPPSVSGRALGTPPGLRQLSFTGEPGSQYSDCILEVYGNNPSRPALQMFGASNTQGRSILFSVVVDHSQMTPMHAFVSCLARADSLVAGGMMAQH